MEGSHVILHLNHWQVNRRVNLFILMCNPPGQNALASALALLQCQHSNQQGPLGLNTNKDYTFSYFSCVHPCITSGLLAQND